MHELLQKNLPRINPLVSVDTHFSVNWHSEHNNNKVKIPAFILISLLVYQLIYF